MGWASSSAGNERKVGFWSREQVVAMDHRATARMALEHPKLVCDELKALLERFSWQRRSLEIEFERPAYTPIQAERALAEIMSAIPQVLETSNGERPWVGKEKAKRIRRKVAAKHGLSLTELDCDGRQKPLVRARNEAIYLIARETTLSLPQIGYFFNREHTTILASIRSHARANHLPMPRGIAAEKRKGMYANQPRKQWTPERVEMVRSMTENAKGVTEIANQMGVSRAAIHGLRHREGIPWNPAAKNIVEKRDQLGRFAKKGERDLLPDLEKS